MADNRTVNETIPVTVIVQKHNSGHSLWSMPVWKVLAAFPDDQHSAGFSQRILHQLGSSIEYQWTGLALTLAKHSAESYWYNLSGKNPSLFVICRINTDGSPQPYTITADHDEAGAHMEADDMVLSTPISHGILQQLEIFVMAYYRPDENVKRKRQDWSDTHKP